MIGASGRGLSAGEAQLLAFTRVFLRDPGLVVLDEATSRLDPLTEGLVEKTSERLLAGRTAVIIAHRLRTVSRVERVLSWVKAGPSSSARTASWRQIPHQSCGGSSQPAKG